MSKSLHKIDLPVLTSNDLTPWASALSKLGLTVDENSPSYAYFNSYTRIKIRINNGNVYGCVSINGTSYVDREAVSSSSVLNKNMSLLYYRFGDSGICFNILESNAQPKTNVIIIPANANAESYLYVNGQYIWTKAMSSSGLVDIKPVSSSLQVDRNDILGNTIILVPVHDGNNFRNDIFMTSYKNKELSTGYYLISINDDKYLIYNVGASSALMSYAIPLDLIWDDSQYT